MRIRIVPAQNHITIFRSEEGGLNIQFEPKNNEGVVDAIYVKTSCTTIIGEDEILVEI